MVRILPRVVNAGKPLYAPVRRNFNYTSLVASYERFHPRLRAGTRAVTDFRPRVRITEIIGLRTTSQGQLRILCRGMMRTRVPCANDLRCTSVKP
jgi:hypothetical protein